LRKPSQCERQGKISPLCGNFSPERENPPSQRPLSTLSPLFSAPFLWKTAQGFGGRSATTHTSPTGRDQTFGGNHNGEEEPEEGQETVRHQDAGRRRLPLDWDLEQSRGPSQPGWPFFLCPPGAQWPKIDPTKHEYIPRPSPPLSESAPRYLRLPTRPRRCVLAEGKAVPLRGISPPGTPAPLA